jgi:hypothetical protein
VHVRVGLGTVSMICLRAHVPAVCMTVDVCFVAGFRPVVLVVAGFCGLRPITRARQLESSAGRIVPLGLCVGP